MKSLRVALCALLATACLVAPASAQRGDYRGPPNRGFAPEQEGESNSMSYLLGRGYQIVAGWDGTLVLQRQDRVYICPYSRYRSGSARDQGSVTSGMCQHIREGIQY